MRYYNDRKKYIIGGAILLLLCIGIPMLVITLLLNRPGNEITDRRMKQIEGYEQVLEANPADVNALIQIGNLYKSLGEYDRAIEYYLKALKHDPGNYDALNELGHAYALKGDYDRAIDTFNTAKKFRPAHPSAYNRSATSTMTRKNTARRWTNTSRQRRSLRKTRKATATSRARGSGKGTSQAPSPYSRRASRPTLRTPRDITTSEISISR